ncbi:unannotated protein [freshwater metagenome]|uniref:Unannotated protein n=1 Tax=freshwater metagenome TaxID=449393 RepID=A0A6J7QPQ4_9ZZZZ|nr:hypothetical protein [Actinomycetota bacterium]
MNIENYDDFDHDCLVSNSQEVLNLNSLVNDIKVLTDSLAMLDNAISKKDSVSQATALDAINFRVREISKQSLKMSQSNFPIDKILSELSSPTPSAKNLHDSMDTQLESLRKLALSQILTLSLE